MPLGTHRGMPPPISPSVQRCGERRSSPFSGRTSISRMGASRSSEPSRTLRASCIWGNRRPTPVGAHSLLPDFVVDALRRAKAEQNKRRLLLGEQWVERNLVVDRGDGEHWVPPSFSTGWRRFASKASLVDVPLLALRHGSATLMLAAGVPDPVAAQIMGHADTRILRRYQDVVPELKREAAKRMSELLGG